MEITLKIRHDTKNGNNRLIYSLSPFYRVLMAFILVIVAAAVISGDTITPFSIIFVLVCITALLYKEEWIFDNTTLTCSYSIGLYFLNKKQYIPYSAIESFSIHHFAKGRLNQTTLPSPEKMPWGSQTRLILNRNEAAPLLINTIAFSRRQAIIKDGKTIAEFTKIPLSFDN